MQGELRTMRGVRTQLVVALTIVAAAACLVIGLIEVGRDRLSGRRVSLEGAVGPQDVNVHLRSSSDSIAWACGGKEVADVCLLATETCVHSMQKKVSYTVAQGIARDLGTCSCFQNNGCSASCNSAMMSTFAGYVSVADCPLDSTAFLYSSVSPYDMFGEHAYDSDYSEPMFPTFFKTMPGAQQLAGVQVEEPVYAMRTSVRVMAGRKV